MKTENEKKALDLAKKVFEHFTSDALPLAREIIAIENEITNPLQLRKQNEGQPGGDSPVDFPISDISPNDMGITEDAENAKPLHRERTISSEVDNLPF